jgi:hypothetical protein
MTEPDKPGQEARPDYYARQAAQEEPAAPRLHRPAPPAEARCAHCGSADIAALPSFSIGMGLAYCPLSEDVLCRHCGYSGVPAVAGILPDSVEDGVRARSDRHPS